MKNERGSALLVVLLTITVFSIIGLSIIKMNLNSSIQVDGSGNKIQSVNLAEMGIEHMKKSAEEIIEQNKTASLEETKNLLRSLLPAGDRFPAVNGQSAPAYEMKDLQVTSEVVERERVFLWKRNLEERVSISFTSHGYSEDGAESAIRGEMTVFRPRDVNRFPSLLDLVIGIVKAPFQVLRGTHSFNESAYFDNGVVVESNSTIHFFKDLYLKGETIVNANADVLVSGNAHVDVASVKSNDPRKGNLGLLCVEGTIYLYGDNPPPVEKGFTSCTEVANQIPSVNGIYAKAAVIIGSNQQQPEWKKENMEWKAEYK